MIGGAVGGGGGGGFDASIQGASIEEAAAFVAHDRQVYINDALDARGLGRFCEDDSLAIVQFSQGETSGARPIASPALPSLA